MEAAIFKLASKYEAEVFMTCIEFSNSFLVIAPFCGKARIDLSKMTGFHSIPISPDYPSSASTLNFLIAYRIPKFPAFSRAKDCEFLANFLPT